MAGRHERRAAIDFGYLKGKVKLKQSSCMALLGALETPNTQSHAESILTTTGSCETCRGNQFLGHARFYSFAVT